MKRHKPDFEIKTRGRISKYYTCKVCGFHSYFFKKIDAIKSHSEVIGMINSANFTEQEAIKRDWDIK